MAADAVVVAIVAGIVWNVDQRFANGLVAVESAVGTVVLGEGGTRPAVLF